MNGLNFVLIPWISFFDPYNTQITRVMRELWEADYLSEILKHVGNVVRIDQNTLLRLKGKFVRVCVNIDITKPLPGFSPTLKLSEGIYNL